MKLFTLLLVFSQQVQADSYFTKEKFEWRCLKKTGFFFTDCQVSKCFKITYGDEITKNFVRYVNIELNKKLVDDNFCIDL